MEFGQVASPEGIDWRLPPNDPSNLARFGGVARTPRLHLGTVGWSYREWVGEVYPIKTPVHDYLKAYARVFDSVELNATFYRVPQIEQAEAWSAVTPPDFRFCPKVTQTLSHVRPLGGGVEEEFVLAMQAFGSRLGTVFLQLPPDFTWRRAGELREFFDRVAGRIPLTVEFRHESFFAHGTLRPELSEGLARRGVGAVVTDTGGRRDVLHSTLTAPQSLVRFLGTHDDAVDEMRLRAWAERLTEWRRDGVRDVYFFIHQPDNVRAPDLVARAARILRAELGEDVFPSSREGINAPPPRPQLSLFE